MDHLNRKQAIDYIEEITRLRGEAVQLQRKLDFLNQEEFYRDKKFTITVGTNHRVIVPLPTALEVDIYRSGKRITAIKIYRERTHVNLRNSKAAIETAAERYRRVPDDYLRAVLG